MFSVGHLPSSASHEQHSSTVMTGNPVGAGGVDYGVRSVAGAGGYPSRATQAYHGGGMDAGAGFNSYGASNTADSLKGFECSDLDNALLGSGGFHSNAGSDGQMYPMPNRTMATNPANMPYGEYGHGETNTEGFGYGHMNRSHAYNRQYMSSAVYGRQTRGMNSMSNSLQQHPTNSDYSSEHMTRRMSIPAAESNVPTQSYARSNSYPVGTPYENSHNQYPSSSQSYSSMTGYNQTAFSDLDTNASNMADSQMRRTQANSYLQPYSSSAMKKPSYPTAGTGAGSEGWSDSGYSAPAKFPSHSPMSNAKALHLMDSAESSGMYPQFPHGNQNSTNTQGMQYTNTRQGTYSSVNNEITTNHYPSVNSMDICPPTSASMNYSNKIAKPFAGGSHLRQGAAYSEMATGQSRAQGYKNFQDSQASAMGQSNVSAGSQRLRHYGPMPNQNQSQGMHHLPYRAYGAADPSVNSGQSVVTPNMDGQYQNYDQFSGASSTRHERLRSLDGRFVSGAPSVQTGMGASTFPVQSQNQRSFESATQQQGVSGQSFGSTNPAYYNTRTKSDTFSPTSVQTNAGCPEMYTNQTYLEGQQRYNVMNCSSAVVNDNCPPAYQMQSDAAQTQADIRRNMIFSAELEKLARLSRDPMADDFPGGLNAISGASQIQDSVSSLPQPVKNPPYLNGTSANVAPGLFNNQGPTSVENSTSMGKSFQSPSATTTSITTNQSVKMTSAPSSVTESCAAVSSAPSTPSSNAAVAQQTSPDSNSARPIRTSPVTNPTTSTPTTVTSQDKGKDSENAVQQLQRLTQSLKEKKDDGVKGSHMEYLSHSGDGSSSIGGQNCIAALSAACRNMIADMDSSVPKLTSTSHSPLGMKSVIDNPGNILGQKYTPTPSSQTSYGPQMPEQMFSPPGASGQNISPPLVSMGDSFGSPSYSTASVPSDYQMQFSDFLEQSVPMQMNTRRPEDKPRKKGKRKKSDEVNDMLAASTIGPKKRRGRKKSSQNPLSVESFDQPPSLENLSASTPLSDGQLPLVEENSNRSATQTPNMPSNSWRTSDTKLNSSESVPSLLSNHQPPSVDSDSATQDFLDSVFSPDTTMSATNHEPVDSFSQLTCINQSHHSPASSLTSQQSMNETASTGSYSSQGGLTSRTSQNYQLDNMDQSKLAMSQAVKANRTSNSTVSSTGDLVSNPVSTSSDATDANSEMGASEEVHPLKILQAQIQLQRQQFNLNDSRPLPLKNTSRKTAGVNPTKKTGPSSVQGEVDVNVLMAEEDATWYVPSEQPKEPEVPWENTRKNAKGQQQADANPVDRRTQNKLLEQKRRDSMKNSIDNLKNALPDGRNLADQTQHSVLLKAQSFIKDMVGKQQRSKSCLEDLKSVKSRNSMLEDNIALLKQEYDILR
ncbi:mucin-5AC-like isoform X2 [Acanthaster planci]|uniref:Mucin-5AC-like isoform X2 n=1 Tax=Acanthaster planci TaxID=133434 RepID=A0A8B7ZKK4_ACAPL|nr:mucin-5AC-like isoform X2 [Acanthaster planci]